MLQRLLGVSGIAQFITVTLLSAFFVSYYGDNLPLSTFKAGFRHLARAYRTTVNPNMSTNASSWHEALESLPSTPEKIPAFFFAHGSPMLAFPPSEGSDGGMMSYHGPTGPLAKFLKEFGPTLLKKYKPKGVVVFSAHWETHGERLGNIWSLVLVKPSTDALEL